MKKPLTIHIRAGAGILLGALIVVILSPALALMNIAATHGAKTVRGIGLAGELLGMGFIVGTLALAIDTAHFALRHWRKHSH